MFVASKLPKNNGSSGWVEMLPRRLAKPALESSITADVVVIGGGFAGLSAARQIVRLDPTVKVVVLEAGLVGDGASGRNSGFIIDLPHEVSAEGLGGGSLDRARRDIKLYRTAIDLGMELAEEHSWGKEVFDPCGRYSVARGTQGDEHILSYGKQLDALGEKYELLNTREIGDVTGSPAYTSGMFMPGTVMIQPADYVRRFADTFRDPVCVYEQTPALSFKNVGGSWVVKTPKGVITAGKVILANNGHAQSFGFFKGQLLHVFTYASLTERFDPKRLPGHRTWAATPALPMGTTIRRISDGDSDRILVRWRYSYNPSLTIGDSQVNSAGRVHDEKFLTRFPTLKGLRMQYRWGGPMALTWNSVPAFGEVAQGVISACGCNGLGASKSSAAGIAAADLALGVKSELVDILKAYEKPKQLPPQPFLTIGAKANMKFKELRAGDE
ncbi:NAD(P)/FAD-dependent oxidoreductase [Pseudomonas vlassakiae]|uniref:FAD-binding oxidoreductase n=1 Tax=Pseudomonas vlassakiae TaxID=485888 RepID=A0A923K7N7_9PSED|nr:FAD-binding oxidoreductase [Pseudomonas vlassakiae]MBV4542814.1 FAD-binding oxidoreductase [Pseudomonas vlassakiae]